MSTVNFKIVVPWHQEQQLDEFKRAWHLTDPLPEFLILQHDKHREGCAVTKNKGIEKAIQQSADVVIVLDSDCYPCKVPEGQMQHTLYTFGLDHVVALQPQEVLSVTCATWPPSRGTPYHKRTLKMPVAASMGFWEGVPDLDAPSQLVHGAFKELSFYPDVIHGRYFPLCGMNLAFHVKEYPWCRFINVNRFDDIWQGWLWQRKAYAEGKCFNLRGPRVHHARQSNVWANLKIEAEHLERNETLWSDIATGPLLEYDEMLKLHKLPA